VIQLLMVALIISFPGLVSGGLAKKAAVKHGQMQIEVPSNTQRTRRRSRARGDHPISKK